MRIYDRLYGELVFPEIIKKLLDCPALLRLRDVRMANNQFAAFPSFSNTSRYEHSLGVCHLADICANTLSLPEKDRIELMMACLYHDVGTPPFAHAMEEVLQAEYNFDHENNLRHIIEGTNNSYIGSLEQIYLDGAIKLKSVCQSKQGRSLELDVYRIAKIIVGDKSEYLSVLLNGSGMDLDNIDNVVRASTAMGIVRSNDCNLAERLASSFIILDDGSIGHNALYMQDIKKWQQMRDNQYNAIFDSVEDFAYQTMIKKALNMLMKSDDSNYRLNEESWKLTDASIIHDYLLKNASSSSIIKNVLLEKPFRCLGLLYVKGANVSSYINTHITDIETIVSNYYSKLMGIVEAELEEVGLSSVIANFYPDKRERQIKVAAQFMGTALPIDNDEYTSLPGAILGLFTPLMNNRFNTIITEDGKRIRKLTRYTTNNLQDIIDLLTSSILKQYEVTVYGKRKTYEDSNESKKNQLGFF